MKNQISFLQSAIQIEQIQKGFSHDDFHLSNINLDNNQYAGVIDFNRFDLGDPYFEFVKDGFFSREVSTTFSRGQINGYFRNRIPEDFWRIYAIYMGMTIFSAIVWTTKTSVDNIKEMLERVTMVMNDQNHFENIKPFWF